MFLLVRIHDFISLFVLYIARKCWLLLTASPIHIRCIGDDTEHAFKIKKPTHSKRVAKQLKKLMLKEKEEAHSTPSASPKNVYTDQSLQVIVFDNMVVVTVYSLTAFAPSLII